MLMVTKKCPAKKGAGGTTFSEVGRLPIRGSAGQEEKLGETISHIAKIVK